jgi:hypothetical protein
VLGLGAKAGFCLRRLSPVRRRRYIARLSIWHSVVFGVSGSGLSLQLQAGLQRLQAIEARTTDLADQASHNKNELQAGLQRLQAIEARTLAEQEARRAPETSGNMIPAIGQTEAKGQFQIIIGSVEKTSNTSEWKQWYITPNKHLVTFKLTFPLGIGSPSLVVHAQANTNQQIQSAEIFQENDSGAPIRSCPIMSNTAICSLGSLGPGRRQIKIHTANDDQIEISLGSVS